MPLSQSSKQGLTVMYLRSLRSVTREKGAYMHATEQCVAVGATSYVQLWVSGRQAAQVRYILGFKFMHKRLRKASQACEKRYFCTSNSVKQAKLCKLHNSCVAVHLSASPLSLRMPVYPCTLSAVKCKQTRLSTSKAGTPMEAPTLTFHDAAAIAVAKLRHTEPVRSGTRATPQTSTQPLHAYHCDPVQNPKSWECFSHQACIRNVHLIPQTAAALNIQQTAAETPC